MWDLGRVFGEYVQVLSHEVCFALLLVCLLRPRIATYIIYWSRYYVWLCAIFAADMGTQLARFCVITVDTFAEEREIHEASGGP